MLAARFGEPPSPVLRMVLVHLRKEGLLVVWVDSRRSGRGAPPILILQVSTASLRTTVVGQCAAASRQLPLPLSSAVLPRSLPIVEARELNVRALVHLGEIEKNSLFELVHRL